MAALRPKRTLRALDIAGDVPPNITVAITEPVIMCSVRCHSGKCLLSQGLRYLGSDIYSVNCTADLAMFNYKGYRYFYPIPASLKLKIIDFDDGKETKPFKVTLRGGARRPIRHYDAPRPSLNLPRKRRRGSKQIVGARACIKRYHGLKIIERAV